MCGIAGYSGLIQKNFNEVCDSISHRGPDDKGFFIDLNLGLSHRRLSIIDLTDGGHQPMFYSKEKGASSAKHYSHNSIESPVAIVLNGEIYNFSELKSELKNLGYTFSTASDTEVVLASYLEWGTECVTKFNGMWAFCIFDKRNNTLFLSRDRTGKKPLYYYLSRSIFIFGSEMKILFKAGVPKEINNDAVNHYFIYRFFPGSESAIKGIKKLQPSHNLIFDISSNKIVSDNCYFTFEIKESISDKKVACSRIYSELEKSVERRLISDVPVGAFLSGGVDSSVIVYFMRKHISNLKTFSVKFDYKDYNESSWAKIISDKFKTEHYEVEFNSKDVLELTQRLSYFYDEPYADASMIPTFLVSKAASSEVTVCLSGTGGDELFGGYTRYKEMILLNKLKQFNPVLQKILVGIYSIINSDKAGKLEQLLKTQNSAELYLKLFSHLFRSKSEPSFNFQVPEQYQQFFKDNNILNDILLFDQNVFLPEDLLVKEDRATMANGLEGRMPFLDLNVIGLANSLHSNLKIYRGETKYILKETFRGILPDEILFRRKKGFGVPLEHYFRKELKDFAYEKIVKFGSNEFIDQSEILKLWNLHQQKKSDYTALFWIILMYNLWYEKWIK